MTEGSKYQVPNLLRALKIIEYISQHKEPLTQAQISQDLGFPSNSVFRITSTLEAEGYLIRQPEGKGFSLSRKFLSVGYNALIEASLHEKALPVLRKLRDESGETALLGIMLDGCGVVVDQILSREQIKFMITVGTKFNLHTAAPAKAMLAYLGEEEQERQIEKIEFNKFTEKTIDSAEALRNHLKVVRENGYATDVGEEAEGVNCIGAPILDYRNQPCAAIWVTGPEFRVTEEKLEELSKIVLKYAQYLSKSLGYQA